MYYISDDKEKIQINKVICLLKQSYWANKRSRNIILTSIENSLCFGVYTEENNLQVAFARVITDYSTSYYLCDVIVDEKYRGNGIGKALVETIVKDKRLCALRGILATGDAHGLYEKFGFEVDNNRFMGRRP